MHRILAACLLSLSACPAAGAQTGSSTPPAAAPPAASSRPAPPPFRLVLPTGPGVVLVSATGEWHPAKLLLFDQGTRPSLQMQGVGRRSASFLLFPVPSAATAQDCRENVLGPLLKQFGAQLDARSLHRGEQTGLDGTRVATASYLLNLSLPGTSSQEDLHLRDGNAFGFAAANGLCAEVHLSQMDAGAAKLDIAAWESHLPALGFDPSYQPGVMDYGGMASVFYQNMHDYAAAAIYYKRALEVAPEPTDTNSRNFRRFITDQLAMSYGMSGDVKHSREVNEAAIAKDPDYPLFYYNLACADAEEHKPDAARTHLAQAFARKANTLPGETLPDPRTDDSILKLKDNKPFWAFVESLPSN